MSKTILPPWTVAPCIECGDDYQATRIEPGPAGLCDHCDGMRGGREEQQKLTDDLRKRLAEVAAERDALREATCALQRAAKSQSAMARYLESLP